MTITERAAALIEGSVRRGTSLIVAGIASFNRWQLPPRDARHPVLTGNYPAMSDELTLTVLALKNVMLTELDGRYMRIRLNPIDVDPRSYHFFTGDVCSTVSESRMVARFGIATAGSDQRH